jgi:hypothetical protein
VIPAKITCRMTMPYRKIVRLGLGSRSWHTRMAMEMLGKLNAPTIDELDGDIDAHGVHTYQY